MHTISARPSCPSLITCESIRAHKPCYNPSRHLPADYQASLADFLITQTQVPAGDRIWVATRLMNDRDARLFACWCARTALSYIANPDARLIAAVDVAERFATGNATAEELDAAYSAAYSAAYAAAQDAAAYDATWSAAYAAWSAWCAARPAAWYAARPAAWYAARPAAWYAARSAAEYAAWSAAYAAWSAARQEQCEWLSAYLTDLYGA